MSKKSIQKEVDENKKFQTVKQIVEYKSDVLDAMEEAKKITRDAKEKRYNSFQEVLNDID